MQNDKKYTERNELVSEIAAAYGTDPSDVTFFAGDSKPFLGFETSCAMLNRLKKPQSLRVVPVESISADSISHECSIFWEGEGNFESIGVVNRSEKGSDGQLMNDQQLAYLASSRALRSTLRIAAVDLLRLHWESKQPLKAIEASETKPLRASLIGQAHAIAAKVGYIIDSEKTLWYRLLHTRYQVQHSNELTDQQLSDLVAFLKTLRPAEQAAGRAA